MFSAVKSQQLPINWNMVLHQTHKLLTKLLLISYLLVRKVSTVIYEPTSTDPNHHQPHSTSNNNANEDNNQQSAPRSDNTNVNHFVHQSKYYYQPDENVFQSSNQMINSGKMNRPEKSKRPARRMLTEMIYYPPMKPYFSSEPVSRNYLPPTNHDRVDPWPSPWPSPPHEEDHDDLEKTFLHYIFPTILVIGLGSLIIPIIAVFFIAFTYTNSGSCIKSKNKSIIDKRGSHLIPNILDLLVSVEKAFSRGEAAYKTKLKKLIPNKQRESRSSSSSSSLSSSKSSQWKLKNSKQS
ncbi:uncharacterized protein LOC128393031 [Panonychus citri]|uniref:uncharacterized protein LOC128393031 n=1 Tax=Panonychus citri TaxID=50023 RepID=UPI002307EA13|nr:uncharacterized protein LOC128393031 [Panonychus citri]